MEQKATNVYQALLKAQGEFETLKKTETAEVPTKSGGRFTYQYVDLEAVLSMVLPILHKHGLVLTQGTDIMGNTPVVVTTITHAESGDAIFGSYPLVSVDPNDPQKLGASLTYARRYALLAMLGIATEDNDATTASRSYSAPPAPQSASQPHQHSPAPSTGATPRCPICGGEMWDNRENKKNPKAPDFKCKDRDCEGVIWPPKKEPVQHRQAFDQLPSEDPGPEHVPAEDIPF